MVVDVMHTDVTKEFGRTVRGLREERGWSQEKLSQLLKSSNAPLSRDAVTRLEAGKRPTSLTELLALAEVLSTSVGHLLGIETSSVSTPSDVVLDAVRFNEALDQEVSQRANVRRVIRQWEDARDHLTDTGHALIRSHENEIAIRRDESPEDYATLWFNKDGTRSVFENKDQFNDFVNSKTLAEIARIQAFLDAVPRTRRDLLNELLKEEDN